MRAHGRKVCITGKVRSLPVPGRAERTFYVESDGVTFPACASPSAGSLPDLKIDCIARISGIRSLIASDYPIAPLSPRQTEILESIVRGLSNSEIVENRSDLNSTVCSGRILLLSYSRTYSSWLSVYQNHFDRITRVYTNFKQGNDRLL